MRFEPVDVLASVFAAMLAAAGLLRWGAMSSHGVVFLMLFLAAVPLLVAFLRARLPNAGPGLRTFFDFYVIGVVLFIFLSLGPFIRAVNPNDRDAWLIALDRKLFGVDPTVWLEPFATPFLSDVLTVFYTLYYFHPIVLGALIYRDDRRLGRTGPASEFRKFGFVAVFAFFLSYVGYFAVPAIGPRFTVEHAGPLPRGEISRVLDATLNQLESNKRDCFPSGHTLVVCVVLIEAWRRSKGTFLGFLPFAVGLLAATVYARYHYVVDVIAGFLLAWPCVAFGRWVVEAVDRRRRTAGP